MKKILISAIVPVWNTGESACRLIRELLRQRDDVEVIAVDDGSTDDSLARLKALEAEVDGLTVVAQKNAGPGAARNAGINISQGEYLCFLDSDDMILPGFLDRLAETAKKHPKAALVATGVKYRKLQTGSEKDVYMEPRRKRRDRENLADYVLYLLLLDGRLYGVINKLFRAETIRRNGLRFEAGRDFAEDTNFVLDYLKYTSGDIIKKNGYTSGDIIFLPEALYVYNYGTETSVVKKSATKWSNWQRSYDDLVRWAREVSDGQLRLATKIRLGLVKARWRVSYWRARKRAQRLG